MVGVPKIQCDGMSPAGRHFVVDYWGCDSGILDDEAGLALVLNKAAVASGATILSTSSHRFGGQGVTVVSILAESHISIHTWPEANYAAVDIYTCGSCEPDLAHAVLIDALSSHNENCVELQRGQSDSIHSGPMGAGQGPLRSGLEEDNTWFLEGSVPGRRNGNVSHGFAIDKLIAKGSTPFQDYMILDTPLYGRVLVLDGIVQLSTSDEHIYHEMLIHPAMFAHPKPQRVLIVGGGDGATLREVLRHNPKQVVMIDIDEQFVRSAAAHLPSLSDGAFGDPRLELLFEDARTALPRFKDTFDVAIIDCNDAVGTSEPLFEEAFYSSVDQALKAGAVCAVQAGSMLDMDFLTQVRQRMSVHLGHTTCFKMTIPSYHCGEYVFIVASKSSEITGLASSTLRTRQVQRGIDTRYWSPEIHDASQVFPKGSPLS